MVELRQRHWPEPLWPRPPRHAGEHRADHGQGGGAASSSRGGGPRDTIVSVAGNIEWAPLRDQVERLLGDWKGGGHVPFKPGPAPGGQTHVPKDTTQTQIALAYPSVPFGHAEYYAAQGAVQVLSGGMGARLFPRCARNAASVIRCMRRTRRSRTALASCATPARPTSGPRKPST